MTQVSIHISKDPLNILDCYSHVQHPSAGGIDVFVGTVRNATKGEKVLHLNFESYEPMALKEMHKIAQEAMNKWELYGIAIHHRVGKLEIGEIPVIIATSSAHRKEAFEATRFLIDQLKITVPIWKKEYLESGEVWVAAHP